MYGMSVESFGIVCVWIFGYIERYMICEFIICFIDSRGRTCCEQNHDLFLYSKTFFELLA